MNKPNTQNSVERTAVAKRIDEIATGAMELFKASGSFESELAVAQAMNDLRLALSDDVMKPVMALMNTDLGFRTDRDPKLTPKDKDGNPMTPYSVDVVREVTIEAKLRGFHMIGNEVNIIAGRFYACKNGFRRKVTQWAGVTDFKDSYEVPRYSPDGKGAIVKARATWNKDGISQNIEREIPIRVNAGMGSDAILGKAQRKLLASVHDRLSGVVTPEGEANEEVDVQTAAAKPSARFAESKPVAEAPSVPPSPTPQPAKPTPQEELAEIVTSAGYSFDDFIRWGREAGNLTPVQAETFTGFGDIPENLARRYVAAKTGLLRGLKLTPQPAGKE